MPSNNSLSVSPERGLVSAEGTAELELQVLVRQPGHMAATLELDLRGGKVLKLLVKAEGVLPHVHVEQACLTFPRTFIGATSQLPLTLTNTSPVPATLMCDLLGLVEFGLTVSRDAWAATGYAACPVKRIGANSEMSAVGSTRGSRR
jgi:hypothetical protein